jgi:hypothetical protein
VDLKQHLKHVDILTQTFCLMPTLENLNLLRNAVRQMESECEVLIEEHSETWS